MKYPKDLEFTTMFHGIEVDVIANNFDSDKSVSIPFCPNDLIVKTKEGIELELDPHDMDYLELIDKSIKLWWESDPDIRGEDIDLGDFVED